MTYDPNYAPFPSEELESLAKWHDAYAKHSDGSFTRGLNEDRAKACRDANLCHDAVRERCLLAELEVIRLTEIVSRTTITV